MFATLGAACVGLILAGFAGNHPLFGLVALGLSLVGAFWNDSPFIGVVLGCVAVFATIALGISAGLVALAIFATFVLWGIKS